jgi:hypothetical protein
MDDRVQVQYAGFPGDNLQIFLGRWVERDRKHGEKKKQVPIRLRSGQAFGSGRRGDYASLRNDSSVFDLSFKGEPHDEL